MTVRSGDTIRIEAGWPVHRSRVYVNGEDFPVYGYTIDGTVGEAGPTVQLRAYVHNEDEPIVIEGMLVKNVERLDTLEKIAQLSRWVLTRRDDPDAAEALLGELRAALDRLKDLPPAGDER